MLRSRLVLPLLSILGCAHQPAQPAGLSSLPPATSASDAAPDAAEPAVRRLLADQVAAWNRGDLEGYMAGYWRSPQLMFYGGGSVTTGWTETLARYRRRYQGEGKAMGTLEFANLEVQVLGRDAALARGRWTLHFAPAPASAGDGRPADKVLSGLFTVVLRHLPEGWRVVHDHSCAD